MINGETVPATSQTVDALTSLRDRITRADDAPKDEQEGDSDDIPAGPLFLTVSENFEQVEYAENALGPAHAFSAPEFPSSVRSSPKSHQRVGFEWLAEAWCHRVPGALLANDMGLGKTYQLLAFLAWLKKEQHVTDPFLIIAPTGLLENWRQEIRLHLSEGALGPELPG